MVCYQCLTEPVALAFKGFFKGFFALAALSYAPMLQCSVATTMIVKQSALRVLLLGVLTMGQDKAGEGGRGAFWATMGWSHVWCGNMLCSVQ